MKHDTILALAGMALVAPAAQADEIVTFSVGFAEPVLSPGEVQTVPIWAHMNPGIGQPAVWNTLGETGQVGTVWSLFYATLDLLNVQNGQTGYFSNAAVGAGFNMISNPGNPSGGGVTGIMAAQGDPFFGGQNQANPILIWSATWVPMTYVPRTVIFDTAAPVSPQVFLADVQVSWLVADEWGVINGSASFQVIPEQSAVTAIAVAALVGFRHRRRNEGADQ